MVDAVWSHADAALLREAIATGKEASAHAAMTYADLQRLRVDAARHKADLACSGPADHRDGPRCQLSQQRCRRLRSVIDWQMAGAHTPADMREFARGAADRIQRQVSLF